MSGHSKWSTIKRKKGAEDAKRGKIFTRLARDITIAARESGGDENANPKLKLAIGKAKAANMPKDNIERAIKRGTGELDGGQLDEITYEGYGPEGVAIVIEVLTDNRNRSLADIKYVFNRGGGSLASAGSVLWQFEKKGFFVLDAEGLDFEEVFMVAAEAGGQGGALGQGRGGVALGGLQIAQGGAAVVAALAGELRGEQAGQPLGVQAALDGGGVGQRVVQRLARPAHGRQRLAAGEQHGQRQRGQAGGERAK